MSDYYYYEVKVAFLNEELGKDGKPKSSAELMLVYGTSVFDVEKQVQEHLKSSIMDTEIVHIKKTKIASILGNKVVATPTTSL